MMLQNYLDTESGWAVSGPHCLQQVHVKAVLAALVWEPQPEPPERLLPSRRISQ